MTGTVPRLNSGVRVKHDRVRDIEVLLGPERALMLDDIGTTIMAEVDGNRSIGEISADLAQRFNAPRDEIEGDVLEFLNRLADSRMVVFEQEGTGR